MWKMTQLHWMGTYWGRLLVAGVACGCPAAIGDVAEAVRGSGAPTEIRRSTRAAVAEVRGTWTENEGRVVWQTGPGWGTAGFRVYRIDPESGEETCLNETLLPAAFYESSATYAVADPEAVEGGAGTYRLEETELSGAVLDWGAHAVVFTPPPPAPQTALAPRSIKAAPRDVPPESSEPSSVLKVALRKEGFYGVSLAAIADGMGLPVEDVQALAELDSLQFTSQGRPVPLIYDAARGRVVFYGQPTDDWYAREASYRISEGEGLSMPRRAPGATNGETAFSAQIRFEEDLLPFDAVLEWPEDYYYWNFIISSTNPAANLVDFPFDLDGYGGEAWTLRVDVQGWSKTTARNPDHRAEFRLNGTPVGSIEFDDQNAATAVLAIPPGVASNGANVLTVRGVLTNAATYSYFVLDGFTAEYVRALVPGAATAAVRPGEATSVSAAGFTEPWALALDEEGWFPTWIADENGELPTKAWAVAGEDERFAVIEAAAIPMLDPEPAAADAWFLAETNGVDYLVIASRALAPAAQELADYRAGQGLRVGVAVFEDVCDLLYEGLRSPAAIPELLGYAEAVWSEPPQMVLLAGNGHTDYLGVFSNEVNHLPPLLRQTCDGLFAADELLADTGGDELPDVAIGRLPARTAEELAAMIAKIKAYEADAEAAWRNQWIFANDRADEAGNFAESVARFTNLVQTPYAVSARIDLDAMALAPARAALFAGIHAGAGVVHYTGHGTTVKLSSQGLLTAADVNAMTNVHTPVVAALCCLAGHFEAPAMDSLAELLMRRPQGGAVAVWASSALSLNAPATDLGEAFYRAVLQEGEDTLGMAVLGARRSLPGDLFTRDTLATYNLLGDPALRIAGSASVPEPKLPAQVFLQDLAQTYDGTARTATVLTEPAGLAVDVTYDGSPAAPVSAGSYAVAATVADADYEGTATGTLTVAKAAATVFLGDLAQTYGGGAHAVTVLTEPAGLAVDVTYDGSPAAPTSAGSWAVAATVADANYAGTATGRLTVAKAAAAVTLGGLAQVYDGTARTATVLTEPAGLAVAVAYDGAPAAPVSVGSYAVSAAVVDGNYDGSAAGTLVVAKGDQTIDFPPLADQWTTNRVTLSAAASSGLPVGFAVADGPGNLDGTGCLTFTGAGTVHLVASQPGDDNWNPAPDVLRAVDVAYPIPLLDVSRTNVHVRENGEGRFFVRLDCSPACDLTVSVARVKGSTNLGVKGETVLTFKSSNWQIWQAVTLEAGDDANGDSEIADIRLLTSLGTAQFVRATSLDDDVGTNLAQVVGGSALSGAGAYFLPLMVDGVHTSSSNYGYTVWTRTPPGSFTMDLQAETALARIRLLHWDWTYRAHRYQIESSVNGTEWSLLVDASTGEHGGWEDWDVSGQTARYLRFTGLSNSANSAVCVAEWEVYADPSSSNPPGGGGRLELSTDALLVREAGEGRFFVRLNAPPAETVVVGVARHSGDSHLEVQTGAALTFTLSNWNVWQRVTLAAGDDDNDADEEAVFALSVPGEEDRLVTATALDDDLGENLAREASLTASGGYLLPQWIDGIHTSSVNYGFTVWERTPPGSITMDLQTTTWVSRIRLLNWDWTLRDHRYLIESSADGATWSLLVDASEGEHRGWEDWTVAAPAIRYLRFTGLSNSVNSAVCIAEWEVYEGEEPEPELSGMDRTPSFADREPFPLTVVTSDDGLEHTNGWAAVDGDPNSVWTGRADAGGWYIAVGYDAPVAATNLAIDVVAGSLVDLQVLTSLDGEDWREWPEDAAQRPVDFNYLWLLFAADGTGTVPQVIEIRPQE